MDAEKGKKSNSGRALALVPMGVAMVLFSLVFPRATPPDVIPLPEADARRLEEIVRADHDLAEAARKVPLAPDILALGTALRDFNTLQAKDQDEAQLLSARTQIEKTVRLGNAAAGVDGLLKLRAVQMEAFLLEVQKFEATGVESDELAALAGSFVRRLRSAGWCVGNKIILSDRERRVMFKLTWNASSGLDVPAAFAPTLDEIRALYTLYILHPHAPESKRDALRVARQTASGLEECGRIDVKERYAIEQWRLDKLKKLGTIDPAYPVAFAVGVAEYRSGHYGIAANAFRDWIEAHPDGLWQLRARNHLKAAIEAEQL